MNTEELEQNESDDSSDEDYNPAGVAASGSEEDSAGEDVSGGEENSDTEEGRKRKKTSSRRPRKKIRNSKVKEVEEIEEEKENSKIEELTEEETKLKSDKLWSDFLKDCDPPAKKSQPLQSEGLTEAEPAKSAAKVDTKSKPEPKETTVLTFAGEEVKVEKPAAGRRSGGLGSLLSKIGKAGKLSTLEKSKLDWENFKDKEGIKEDLETFNKGKSGYLERQDFLTRTDVRQFELEKQMRSQRRSLNR